MLESKNIYTLIGYKDDSSDYCRGCHMASYSSEFAFYNNLNPEGLVAQLALLMLGNLRLRINEAGMKFIVLKNGIQLYNEPDSGGFHYDEYNRYSGDEGLEYEEEIDARREEANFFLTDVLANAKTLAEKRLNEINTEVARIEQAKVEAAKKESDESMRVLYESLKNKFENK